MISDGLLAAARALRYWETRQQVLAHNLANVDTPGFKGERVFARLMEDRLVEAHAATDMSTGPLSPTGRPLDLALEGPGFFVVETPDGERLTRGGAMRIDESGRLVTEAGYPLLGDNGPLVLPPGTVDIDQTGMVRVDGREIGRLRVEAAPEGVTLLREAGGLYRPDALRIPMDPARRKVRQGMIEASNVSAIESMVDMLTVQRSFAAVQNSVRVIDEVMATVANDLGRVG